MNINTESMTLNQAQRRLIEFDFTRLYADIAEFASSEVMLLVNELSARLSEEDRQNLHIWQHKTIPDIVFIAYGAKYGDNWHFLLSFSEEGNAFVPDDAKTAKYNLESRAQYMWRNRAAKKRKEIDRFMEDVADKARDYANGSYVNIPF